MRWRVPKIWQGGDVWIIGGGPSIYEQFEVPKKVVESVLNKQAPLSAYSPYMSEIHDKHIIGINAAFMLGNWIDMLFFGDNSFYLPYQHSINQFPNLKVTCHGRFQSNYPNIKYLERERPGVGISDNPGRVRWNKNSGAAAISVAVNAGAKRIILVGFDMKLNGNNQQHWHSVYEKQGKTRRNLPFHRHLLGFDKIKEDADRRGIEIINASPKSAITQFPKISVKELL